MFYPNYFLGVNSMDLRYLFAILGLLLTAWLLNGGDRWLK